LRFLQKEGQENNKKTVMRNRKIKNKSVSSSDRQWRTAIIRSSKCNSVYNDGRDQYLRTVISCGPIVLRRNDKTIA